MSLNQLSRSVQSSNGGAEIFDADALRDVYGVTGSIVDVQGHRLVLIDDEEKETRS